MYTEASPPPIVGKKIFTKRSMEEAFLVNHGSLQ